MRRKHEHYKEILTSLSTLYTVMTFTGFLGRINQLRDCLDMPCFSNVSCIGDFGY